MRVGHVFMIYRDPGSRYSIGPQLVNVYLKIVCYFAPHPSIAIIYFN